MPKTKTATEPDVLVAQAARELGVAVRTVNSWIQQGRITARPLPDGAGPRHPRLIPRAEVDRVKAEITDQP